MDPSAEMQMETSCNTSSFGMPLNGPSSNSPRITFENVLGQGRVNQLGGVFINGRPLAHEKRIQIVEMARRGIKPCKISRELKVSHGAVSKILNRFHETGSILPGQIGGNPRSRLSIQAVRQHILRLREEHPALSAAQIQQKLVQRGICSRQNVPSSSRINRLLKAQKQHALRARERKSEQEGQAAKGANLAEKPLSHSIENILGGSVKLQKVAMAEQQPKNGGDRRGASSGANELRIGGDGTSSSVSPAFCPSSSSSTSSASSSGTQIVSGSDEENQHQQHQQLKTAELLLDGRRARTSFSADQLRLLERTFAKSPYPDQQQKEWLIKATKLDEDKIITWFSNRRARNRRKAFQQHPSTHHQLLMLPNSQSPATNQAIASPSIGTPIIPAPTLFPFPTAFFPALLAPSPTFDPFGLLAAAQQQKMAHNDNGKK